ncbi:hypothetical protein [Sphingomonas sp. RB1R13]|uniref:hypothetical protein n=1 Tax=Sphingomonas sp. RB1R13 TaxID=3096159 RepID=UPI002FCB2A09
MKISPAEGWCLNFVVELDIHAPGTAGAFLRASNERRQVVAAYLSTRMGSTEPSESGELADLITRADHRALLRAAYGEPPAGLRTALARSGPRPHRKQFYWSLRRLLASPEDKQFAATIRQLDELDPSRLLIVETLPPAICTPNLVKLVRSPTVAADVAKLVELLIGNGINENALYHALHRVTTADQLSALWNRWSLKSVFPAHPIPSSKCYTPVTSGMELRGVSLRYRNCVKQYLAQALNSESAFAEFTAAGTCVVHIKQHEGQWSVEGVHAKENGPVAPQLYSAALDYLAGHGIRPRPRHFEAIGPWNVLRRLTRAHMWDWAD